VRAFDVNQITSHAVTGIAADLGGELQPAERRLPRERCTGRSLGRQPRRGSCRSWALTFLSPSAMARCAGQEALATVRGRASGSRPSWKQRDQAHRLSQAPSSSRRDGNEWRHPAKLVTHPTSTRKLRRISTEHHRAYRWKKFQVSAAASMSRFCKPNRKLARRGKGVSFAKLGQRCPPPLMR
jgi:hypothetical protein